MPAFTPPRPPTVQKVRSVPYFMGNGYVIVTAHHPKELLAAVRKVFGFASHTDKRNKTFLTSKSFYCQDCARRVVKDLRALKAKVTLEYVQHNGSRVGPP